MCTAVQVCVPSAPPRWCCIFQWCWIQLFLTACYISSVYQHVFWIWSVFLKIPDRICQHTEYIKYLVSTRQLCSSLLKEGFPISVKKESCSHVLFLVSTSACSLWLCLAFWKSKKHLCGLTSAKSEKFLWAVIGYIICSSTWSQQKITLLTWRCQIFLKRRPEGPPTYSSATTQQEVGTFLQTILFLRSMLGHMNSSTEGNVLQ